MLTGSAFWRAGPLTVARGSSANTSSTPTGRVIGIDNGNDLAGTRYENDSCLRPGAIGATTSTRPPTARTARGEMSDCITENPIAPSGSTAVHVGCASSGDTSVMPLSFVISYTSTTSCDPSTLGRDTITCRPRMVSGNCRDVVSNTVISALSPVTRDVSSGSEKYAMLRYDADTK